MDWGNAASSAQVVMMQQNPKAWGWGWVHPSPLRVQSVQLGSEWEPTPTRALKTQSAPAAPREPHCRCTHGSFPGLIPCQTPGGIGGGSSLVSPRPRPVRAAAVSEPSDKKCREGGPSPPLVGLQTGAAAEETSVGGSSKPKMGLLYDLAVLLLGTYPKEMKDSISERYMQPCSLQHYLQ